MRAGISMRRQAAALVLAALTSLASAAGIATAAVPSPEPTVPSLALPKPVEKRLANGLRVVVFTSTRLPLVQMQLLVPAGSASEPDSLPGLAALTAQLVRRGTSSRTAEQFDTEAAQLGASFATSATRDYALAGCAVGAAHAEQALELLSDAALSAIFNDEAFENGRHEVATTLRQQSQDIAALVDDRVWAAAFGSHPYAHAMHGDIDALLATRAEAVRTFHREHWRPDRAVLAIAGDITPERAFAAAEEWFGRWAGRAVADAPHTAPAPLASVRVIDLADAPYSEIRLAAIAPGRGAAAWPAWQVLAYGLEHGGLPAGFHATLTPQDMASLLVVSGPVPNDSVTAWTTRARHAIEHAATLAAGPQALATLREAAAAAYPLPLETLGSLVSQWQAADHAGLAADGLQQTPERLRAVTAEAYSAASSALVHGSTITAAGPGEKLRRALATFGKVEDLAISEARVAHPTLAVATPEQRRAGRIALKTAVLAHGGAVRLAAARTVVNEGDMTLYAAGNDLQGSFSLVRVDPERLSFATKLLKFENRQTLVGDKGWSLSLNDSAVLAEVDTTAIATLRATLNGDIVHLLRAAQAATDVAARGRESIGGRNCDLVDFTSLDARRVRFAIDRLSHRILAVDTVPGDDGAWHDRRLYSDFRQVGGLVLPYAEDRFLSGERVSTFATRVAAINKPIPPDLFRRPRVVGGILLPGE